MPLRWVLRVSSSKRTVSDMDEHEYVPGPWRLEITMSDSKLDELVFTEVVYPDG